MTAALGLGTAQFGMDYGISNRGGRVAEPVVAALLNRAWEADVRLLDTAAAYGESETVLGRALGGRAFRVVTKTPPAIAKDGGSLAAELAAQLARLDRTSIYGLLVHHAKELLGHGGTDLYRELRALKERGLVERIGVSAYDGVELDAVAGRFDLDLVQIPFNVFDRRCAEGGRLARLKAQGVEIHARSAFLQGVLLMAPEALPNHLRGLDAPLRAFRAAARAAGLTPLQAALSFVKRSGEIDVVIVGVTGLAEFDEVVAGFVDAAPFDGTPLAQRDARLINPSLWPR